MNNQVGHPEWRMGGITVPEVEDYLYDTIPPRDEVLAEMEIDAARSGYAIVGPVVARVLYQLARISKAKTVFEWDRRLGIPRSGGRGRWEKADG